MAGGQADPPMMVRRIVWNFRLFASTCASRPCHTVGTPADTVTPSASNSSYRLLPSRNGPGNTSLAPTMHAAYGRPQALTWNMGTTGRMVSPADQFSASGRALAIVCSIVERWLYSAPLGLPVVPEV